MERDGAERDDRAVRKARLVAGMQRGLPWRAAAAAAAVPVSRSTAYRLRQRAHVEGDRETGRRGIRGIPRRAARSRLQDARAHHRVAGRVLPRGTDGVWPGGASGAA